MTATPPPPDLGSVVQQLAQQFVSLMTTVLTTIDNAVFEIARLAWVSVVLVGVLLYFTRIEKRYGKDLIKGGVALAFIVEFILPAVTKLSTGT
jgi:hypothetical protein